MHARVKLFGLAFVGIFAGLATVAAHRPEFGVQCGSGAPGRPNVISIQVEDQHAAEGFRIVGGLKPDRGQQTEIAIRSGRNVATCHASDPSPFLVWARGLNGAELQVASENPIQVEVLGNKQKVLASTVVEPQNQDTLNLKW